MSKGSWYRKVNKKKFDEGYDRIFGDKKNVDGEQVEDVQVEDTVGEEEAEPYESSDPILRSIEADHRQG